MIVTSTPKRARLLARSAIARSTLGLALALGTVAGTAMLAAPAMAQKRPAAPRLKLSKPFQAVAAPLSTAIEAAKPAPMSLPPRAR